LNLPEKNKRKKGGFAAFYPISLGRKVAQTVSAQQVAEEGPTAIFSAVQWLLWSL
jgi:hypothetical protein